MHETQMERWTHDHTFGTRAVPPGEARTRWVIALTVVMMVVEIAAGWAFGSMALLADGWHMGTHAAALSVTAFAYLYMRRHAEDPRYSFGTGKVGSLGGFASAVALAVVAVLVFAESTWRLTEPVAIQFDYAIGVAVVGLVVNLASALILHDGHHHEHAEPGGHHHHDHNLRAAYLHVLADALTSLLAIFALGAGKFLGWMWMDPVMGIVGSVVIARWSLGLLRQTSAVLLDGEVGAEQREAIRSLIEADGHDRVADLHVWRVGPKHLAVIVSVVTHEPKTPDHYKALLSGRSDLAHLTVEVHRCPSEQAA
jgi:cation diffusion facilitator family transporter